MQTNTVAKSTWTLLDLRTANIARQAEWCPDHQADLAYRGNELAGETGEAVEAALNFIAKAAQLAAAGGRISNVVKKLERERHGWRGSRADAASLAKELADVVLCADLLAMTAGIDLQAAVRNKFNETSTALGLSTMLACEAATPIEQAPREETTGDDDAIVPTRFIKLDVNGDVVSADAVDHVAVRDSTTGLVWSVAYAAEGKRVNWAEAKKAAAATALFGATDWRLPSREELLSLVDNSRRNPAIDTDAFPNTKPNFHWSSSPLAGDSDLAWLVYFDGGDSNYFNVDNVAFVRACRGPVAGVPGQ